MRTSLSPRHVPDDIVAVPAVPRTGSGKKLEVPVKRILMGTAADVAADRDALLDPTSLDPFVALAAERRTRVTRPAAEASRQRRDRGAPTA